MLSPVRLSVGHAVESVEKRLKCLPYMAQATDDRLVNVTIVSIESDILCETDFAAIIKDWCGDRERCPAFEFRLCWAHDHGGI